jgi:hypothetical protein
MDADISSFICGGYFLSKRVLRPRAISGLWPDSVLTVSECFTDVAPDTWADKAYNHDDEERVVALQKFGIARSAVSKLVDLFTQAVQSRHLTNAFPSLYVAQQFFQHCADQKAVALLGIGLERSLVPSFLSQLNDDVNHGYGLIERVNANESLERGGKTLGYEPLGFDATKFHSWLCHNAALDAYKQFGVRPNSAGFIDSFDDAIRITRNLKETGAETAIWEPWLVVEYSADQK